MNASRYEIPPEVMARRIGDELVLLELASGTYFGLNAVGARVWELLGEGCTKADIVERLLHEYDVGRDALENDVIRLLEELAAKRLVRPVPGT